MKPGFRFAGSREVRIVGVHPFCLRPCGDVASAPAPFDKGHVKVALVSYLSQGDYFEDYEAGVARQAKALGVDLRIFQGKKDAALQREQIEEAIGLGVNGIIVSHGQPEALPSTHAK
jgi:simple sugar transport system substrate-binding protein